MPPTSGIPPLSRTLHRPRLLANLRPRPRRTLLCRHRKLVYRLPANHVGRDCISIQALSPPASVLLPMVQLRVMATHRPLRRAAHRLLYLNSNHNSTPLIELFHECWSKWKRLRHRSNLKFYRPSLSVLLNPPHKSRVQAHTPQDLLLLLPPMPSALTLQHGDGLPQIQGHQRCHWVFIRLKWPSRLSLHQTSHIHRETHRRPVLLAAPWRVQVDPHLLAASHCVNCHNLTILCPFLLFRFR